MLYLVTLYSVLSGLAVVLELIHFHVIPAFCVAFLAASAVCAGREIKACLTDGNARQKLGRAVYGILLMAVSLWLSRYPVDLYFRTLPGLPWSLIGFGVGFFTTPGGHLMKRARMR